MRFREWTVVGALVAAFGIAPSAQNDSMSNHPLAPNEKGGMGETGPYEVVPNHFKPPFPQGWTWGPVAGIHAESPDRIYVYSRGMLPALERYMTSDGLPARNTTEANNANSELGPSLRRVSPLT